MLIPSKDRGRHIEIRNEKPNDIEQIRRVIELAFRDALHTDHTEQFIEKALRESGVLALSLVAEADGKIIGHVAFSPVSISDGTTNRYGLGPISVLPQHQGKGVGSRLMVKAFAENESKGASGCIVHGDPGCYKHFGFKVFDGLVFPGISPEYFQAVSFDASFAQGKLP